MNWTATAAILLALGVMIGAFGAHALQGRLDDYSRGIYDRAVFYHFVHALGILIVSVIPRSALSATTAWWVCLLLTVGIILFSGSLYILAVTGQRGLGAITPFGGVAFIVGWCMLAVCLLRGGNRS